AARLRLRDIAEQINRNGPLASDHAQSAWNRCDRRLPMISPRRRVDIAVIHQNLDLQFGGRGGINKVVANKSCVRAVLHPHASLQYRVGAGKSPNRYRAGEMKFLDEAESLRLDGAAGPAIGA